MQHVFRFLQKLRNSPRRNLYFLTSALFIILIFSAFLRFLTPETTDTIQKVPEPILLQPNPKIPTSIKITRAYSYPEVPLEMNVFQIQNSDAWISTLRNTKRLSVLRAPGVWTNESQSLRLSQDPYTNIFTYSEDASTPDLPVLQKENAIELAKSFISQYLGTAVLVPVEEDINYYKEGGSHFDEAAPVEATIIEIPFTYKIDSYKTFFESEITHPVKISVNNEKMILRVGFSSNFFSIVSTSKIATRTIDEALNDLSKATVIQMEYETKPIPFENLLSLNISSVSLEYRTLLKTNWLIPFYRFQGEGETKEGETLKVQFILSAVPTENNSER